MAFDKHVNTTHAHIYRSQQVNFISTVNSHCRVATTDTVRALYSEPRRFWCYVVLVRLAVTPRTMASPCTTTHLLIHRLVGRPHLSFLFFKAMDARPRIHSSPEVIDNNVSLYTYKSHKKKNRSATVDYDISPMPVRLISTRRAIGGISAYPRPLPLEKALVFSHTITRVKVPRATLSLNCND